ncbi:MAG: hypothetical protein NTW19_23635 [Planctomycetota bacterium]|nr:hypothetical protein [Planctomycetota bacterium]
MAKFIEEIELRTHDPAKILRLTEIDKDGDRGVYVCNLIVRSGGFQCDCRFIFDNSHFPDAIEALRMMDSGRPGQAIIKEQWDSDFIKFESNDLGHVWVSGEFGMNYDGMQFLRFSFRTDQTVLGPLIRDLEPLLSQ